MASVALLLTAPRWRGSATSFAKIARGLLDAGHSVRLFTGAEVVAAYSNVLEGTNPAYGLVMAKNSTTFLNARILQETIDSLKFNPAAKALNFK